MLQFMGLQRAHELPFYVPGKESDTLLQEEKGTTEDEMAGWHHRVDGQ